MTREEIEYGKQSCNNFIANRVMDIRKLAEHLEQSDFHNDTEAVKKFLVKAQDNIDSIKKMNDRLEIYNYEVPDEETDELEEDTGYSSGY